MIAPQELRLGNYVEYDGKIFKVKEIRNYIVVCDRGKGNVDFTSKEIEPIQLTEDWLEKFGFDSNNVAYKIDNDRFIFELYFYDAWNLNYVEKQKFGNGSVELSGYWKIHELQNLFFALTGEELKIKES